MTQSVMACPQNSCKKTGRVLMAIDDRNFMIGTNIVWMFPVCGKSIC